MTVPSRSSNSCRSISSSIIISSSRRVRRRMRWRGRGYESMHKESMNQNKLGSREEGMGTAGSETETCTTK
jgi:hypothetical protein